MIKAEGKSQRNCRKRQERLKRPVDHFVFRERNFKIFHCRSLKCLGLPFFWLFEDLSGLLAELEIPVVYARQSLKRYVIQEGTQEGECLWTLAKQTAMTKAQVIFFSLWMKSEVFVA